MNQDVSGYIDLFTTDNPEGNRPHMKGFVKLGGQKFEFACWPARSGKPGVYSGTLKLEQQRQQSDAGYRQPMAPPVQDGAWGDDSSIPF